jgi:hypothetical protein
MVKRLRDDLMKRLPAAALPPSSKLKVTAEVKWVWENLHKSVIMYLTDRPGFLMGRFLRKVKVKQ